MLSTCHSQVVDYTLNYYIVLLSMQGNYKRVGSAVKPLVSSCESCILNIIKLGLNNYLQFGLIYVHVCACMLLQA